MIKSVLMVAGDNEKHLNKIPELKCDIAMVNLEDGMFDKEKARKIVYEKLKTLKCDRPKIVVRVNSLDSCGEDDIKLLNEVKPYAIRVAKIRTKEDVQRALSLIDEDIQVHLSIETKEAFNSIAEFKLDPRVTTLYLGILDLLESLTLPQSILTLGNPTIEYILSKFLIDSKSNGFYPVSFTYQDYRNLNEFEDWCAKEKKMGFSAKSCISPDQVDIVNRTFAPNSKEIERAKYIIEVFEAKKKEGCTGFVDERYGFIDEPIYKHALLVVK
ncbi:HpcH/HpaI aldolase/citrate lyase family protein [Arcobacter sp. FWKO B]|uniref:HpcH/HpaI aldolase/citrate lyase family protein n=1 Tax=Arcobacter sp. FWKO B TaxID=2593672 RepID=UPI0018A67FCD|nr:CoA ester lyase [Arcobacter sp. FWKO B]QOG12946.1 CoA ester lyase [Arcobacter sp. FWKO B]